MSSDTDFGTISLGALIAALEDCEEHDSDVYFDFGGCVPTRCDSYRGYYDHLALGFGLSGRQNVADVLKTLRDADGATFEGYKGGDYVMTRTTPIWVANYGDATGTAIVGVCKKRHVVYILTEHIP